MKMCNKFTLFILLLGCFPIAHAEQLDMNMIWKGTVPPPPSSLNSPTNIVVNNEIPLIPDKFTTHPQVKMTNQLIKEKNKHLCILQLTL